MKDVVRVVAEEERWQRVDKLDHGIVDRLGLENCAEPLALYRRMSRLLLLSRMLFPRLTLYRVYRLNRRIMLASDFSCLHLIVVCPWYLPNAVP